VAHCFTLTGSRTDNVSCAYQQWVGGLNVAAIDDHVHSQTTRSRFCAITFRCYSAYNKQTVRKGALAERKTTYHNAPQRSRQAV
jgi:hypothetical protein